MFAFLLLVHMNFSIKEYGDTDPHSCAVFRSPELVPPLIGGQDLRNFFVSREIFASRSDCRRDVPPA